MSAAPGPGTTPSPDGPTAPPSGPGPRAQVSRMRVGVGLLLGVIAVLVILLDGLLGSRDGFRASAPGTGILLAFLSAAALRELYDLLRAAGIESHAVYGSLASLVLIALRANLPWLGVRPADARALAEAGLLLAILLPAAAAIGFRRKDGGKEEGDGATAAALRPFAGTALGLLVVHVPLYLLLELRLTTGVAGMTGRVPAGLILGAMVAIACKSGDSAAYFVGRTVGKRPLCWVSPKKTWEGAVAGAVVGPVAAALVGRAFGLPFHLGLGFGLVVNLAGQGGDLLESWLKRCCGAKDSGRTFGEMGGALDLLDSLLLAGPAGYLFHQVVLS